MAVMAEFRVPTLHHYSSSDESVSVRLRPQQDLASLLPDDIWLRIFSLLPAKDLCAACQVSCKWYQLATDAILWRQKLSRDIVTWPVISYNTYPEYYNEEWSSKEVYLNCAPDGRPPQRILTWRSLLRLILPHAPTIAMFGPGMESETSGIFRKILMDDSGVFQRVGLTPGEFTGIGSGVKFSLHNRWKFTLTALYSATYRERRDVNQQDRLRGHKLFRHGDTAAGDAPQLAEPVARLCQSVGAFVFVINANVEKDLQELEFARTELQTMIVAASSTVPVLVLSCTQDASVQRYPCIRIVEALRLGELCRPWQVRDCVVDSLDGVAPAMEWLLRKVQT